MIERESSSGKTAIFDLDNCLSAADEVGKDMYRPALEAIRAPNRGALSEIALERAFSDIWHHALDWVASIHGFTPGMLAAGSTEFARLEITRPMRGYPDLPLLATIPARRFLVTSGFRRSRPAKSGCWVSVTFSRRYISMRSTSRTARERLASSKRFLRSTA